LFVAGEFHLVGAAQEVAQESLVGLAQVRRFRRHVQKLLGDELRGVQTELNWPDFTLD